MRLIFDEPAAGSWNMSVDQALLESVADRGEGTLRIYGWKPATLSLGYFQDAQSRDGHAPSRECPLVRRASGGGAILHDAEITYSVAVPWSGRGNASNRNLFDQIHRSLVNCLDHFGIHGCQIFEQPDEPDASVIPVKKPFLCFLRRTPGDVVLGQDKVIGSAQRRARGALLQHGSILFQRSPCAPELPGLLDAQGVAVFAMEEFARRWTQRVGNELGWQLQQGQLVEQEVANAARIENEIFDNDSWTYKR